MPHLFSPYTLKGVTLRNRIVMSPMTMYDSVGGEMDDYHTMYLGARAAGGFGLVFGEQIAIAPEGRTTVHCAGLWDDAQIAGHARMTAIVKRMGSVPAIQLGHTGRKGSVMLPWLGGRQLPPDHPEGWQVAGPSAIAYGNAKYTQTVHELSRDEIRGLHVQYADAARRAAEAGYEWLEMHFAHGYLAASFFSPLANQRTDEYGGSVENRARFWLEALDAVREVWPDHLPLTARVAADDWNPAGIQFEDALLAAGWLHERGLDLVEFSNGGNTDDLRDPPFGIPAPWVERAGRAKRELGIAVGANRNLGLPSVADETIRSGAVDLVFLGRPALANAHWPIWAARELGHPDPFELLPHDWGWWLDNLRGHAPSMGWPMPAPAVEP